MIYDIRIPLLSLGFILTLIFVNDLTAQERTSRYDQPVELGNVSWLRDFDDAKAASKSEGKPIFILFQEVPGCSTCRNYGQSVLVHPLMVEAIENEFIPLTIFNNIGGKDRDVLSLFSEPTWNNPVVRIVDSEGDNIISRLAGDYTSLGLYRAMEEAMVREQREIPGYIEILGDDLLLEADGTEEAVYQMYCFWSGEKHLGQIEGVVATDPGFTSAGEVVKVQYNPAIISKSDLDRIAEKGSCRKTKNKNFRMDRDPQYYLKKSKYNVLPLSKSQRTKINVSIANQESPLHLLSPKQILWLESGSVDNKLTYDKAFAAAWKEVDLKN